MDNATIEFLILIWQILAAVFLIGFAVAFFSLALNVRKIDKKLSKIIEELTKMNKEK